MGKNYKYMVTYSTSIRKSPDYSDSKKRLVEKIKKVIWIYPHATAYLHKATPFPVYPWKVIEEYSYDEKRLKFKVKNRG